LRYLRYGFLVVVVVLVAAACSDDTQPTDEVQAETSTTTQASTTSSTSTPTSTVAVTTTPKPPTIEVVADDYFFEGVPETVPVGTRLSLFNNSAREFHEMVVFQLDPAEQRTIEELSKLSNDELIGPGDLGVFGVGKVLSVVFAMPESEQFTYVLAPPVLAEEGRYIIFCGIHVGLDPIEARNATAQGATDDIDGLPRHYEVGMMTEITATG
jgi:hypothetical protein